MGTVSPITRTEVETAAPAEETPKATLPVKVVNPAMSMEVESIKLQDVSTFLFNQLSAGEISRFGKGWIVRCPECDTLITTTSEFKTFSLKNREKWRLAPSLACPNEDCTWHRSIVIEPEEFEEIEEEAEGTEVSEAEETEETEEEIAEGTEGVQA